MPPARLRREPCPLEHEPVRPVSEYSSHDTSRAKRVGPRNLLPGNALNSPRHLSQGHKSSPSTRNPVRENRRQRAVGVEGVVPDHLQPRPHRQGAAPAGPTGGRPPSTPSTSPSTAASPPAAANNST